MVEVVVIQIPLVITCLDAVRQQVERVLQRVRPRVAFPLRVAAAAAAAAAAVAVVQKDRRR